MAEWKRTGTVVKDRQRVANLKLGLAETLYKRYLKNGRSMCIVFKPWIFSDRDVENVFYTLSIFFPEIVIFSHFSLTFHSNGISEVSLSHLHFCATFKNI